MSGNSVNNPNDPQLSKGMKKFIAIGTVILIIAFVAQFAVGDGFGSNEGFDPDTTLLPHKTETQPAADTFAVDTIPTDSTENNKDKTHHSRKRNSVKDNEGGGSQTEEEITLDNVDEVQSTSSSSKSDNHSTKSHKPQIETLEN